MRTPLIDGKAPGQFRARCNLTRPMPVSELPEYLRREYAEKGWAKETREVSIKGRTRHKECFLEPMCDGFETTDRSAYDAHMREVHGAKAYGGHNWPWAKTIRKLWRGPRLLPEGQPFKPSTKNIAQDLQTCPSCGLIAEVDHRPTNVLWWDEHLRGCGIAQADAPRCEYCAAYPSLPCAQHRSVGAAS